MKAQIVWSSVLVVLGVMLSGQGLRSSGAQESTRQPGEETRRATAWTLDEARDHLAAYPRDVYLQYVALQLAQREGRVQEVWRELARQGGWGSVWSESADRNARVDLFDMFSGAPAVQESLQLDTFQNRRNFPGVPGDRRFEPRFRFEGSVGRHFPEAKVPIEDLTGPKIKSHPWEAMLAGRKPERSPLAALVPADAYFVEFHSVAKLLDFARSTDVWGTHLFTQAVNESAGRKLREQVLRQLAIMTHPELEPFYDLAVEEVGLTGSDLFLSAGSDVTVLFRVKQPLLFRPQMDGFLSATLKQRGDARRTEGEFHGVKYVHVSTPDREVNAFSAYPWPNLHVRSNSLVGLQRVLSALRGKTPDSKPVERLADTDEFAYIRSLMPRGAAEEDGFVYLSDPFIRRLVGPQFKITERRRMQCYNHLRMIGHACLLHQSEHGRVPESLDELTKAECAPGEFGARELACPDGGQYALSPDGLSGSCTHHGSARYLAPCCEILVDHVRGDEANAYDQFLLEYNQYWRTFFDPIALRIQVTPSKYRAETIILPLIDNSIYRGLATVLGGKPEPLGVLREPKRSILSVDLRIHKEQLLAMSGLPTDIGPAEEPRTEEVAAQAKMRSEIITCSNSLKQIGRALQNYHDTYRQFPRASTFDKEGKPTLSWRVAILPFIERAELYNKFHHDEPWDSPHNKALIPRMPAIYGCCADKDYRSGKTRYVGPVGANWIFDRDRKEGVGHKHITDGTANTIMVLEMDEEHAVVWTKPDDWTPGKPLKGLSELHGGNIPVLTADGEFHFLRGPLAPEQLDAMLEINDGKLVSFNEVARPRQPDTIFDVLSLGGDEEAMRSLAKFLTRGIGNQAGLHLYDAIPYFELNASQFLAEMARWARLGGRGNLMRSEFLPIGFLVSSLNSPIYISLPVRDRAVVDEFLVHLDKYVRPQFPSRSVGFLDVATDIYRVPISGVDTPTRVASLSIGPVKWRIFWARIGDGLYVASQPNVLEDLAALQFDTGKRPAAHADSVGHGMIRVQPEHWREVLPQYRLGWAENDRMACRNCQGTLLSASRALGQDVGSDPAARVAAARTLVQRLTGVLQECPELGEYSLSPDGKRIACSVHGGLPDSHQPAAPSETGVTGRFAREFAGMSITLSFLEDGLHTVVTVDRKPGRQ